MKENLKLNITEQKIYNQLRDLGYISATKSAKSDFSIFTKAIQMFKESKGIGRNSVIHDKFIEFLNLDTEIIRTFIPQVVD
jgi:hypothetical protein